MDIISRLLVFSNEMQSDDVFYPVVLGILHHLHEVPYLTIADLAELCAVSQSTISRFARFLNCPNLQAFKLEIALAANAKETTTPPAQLSWSPDAADTEEVLCRSIQHGVHMLTAQLPRCVELAQLLRGANSVAFLFSNIDPVLKLERQLCIDGKKVYQLRKPNDISRFIPTFAGGDVIITTISDPWEQKNKLPIVQRAVERGVSVILLTPHPDAIEGFRPACLFELTPELPMLARIQEEIIFGELTRQYLKH